MHIHILGICGTFMGGVAGLAREMGIKVTGSDANIYPPMSTQLEELGIEVNQYDVANLEPEPDIVVIGNALSRGNPEVEAVLNKGIKYISGPQWLSENFLQGQHVLAVAGTHGKTTTSSMLAWILQYAGLEPGFLIGGIPQNFGISARAGDKKYFVIEADEYDTAFFDKRSKFIHYHPQTLILNNLEFDHADIFADLDAINQQFHFLVRTVPGTGQLIVNADEQNLQDVLDMGCWSGSTRYSVTEQTNSEWRIENLKQDHSEFKVIFESKAVGKVDWPLMGSHNASNALAAIAAAADVDIKPELAVEALNQFINVKRRMEVRGTVNNVTVYDDFAHHPTAISTTLEGLRKRCGNEKIIAILEPRSNTMKMGVHKKTLLNSLRLADSVYIYQPEDVEWNISELENSHAQDISIYTNIDSLVGKVLELSMPGNNLLVMSNGAFAGIHEKLLKGLEQKHSQQ